MTYHDDADEIVMIFDEVLLVLGNVLLLFRVVAMVELVDRLLRSDDRFFALGHAALVSQTDLFGLVGSPLSARSHTDISQSVCTLVSSFSPSSSSYLVTDKLNIQGNEKKLT
jgi:hypothetical protein